jgi:pimeloyl-ACP methyl ester carboxylesterase
MVDRQGAWRWRHNIYHQDDPLNTPLIDSADHLHQLLTDYHAKYPNTTFTLVGHSLGGVVAIEALIQDFGSLTELVSTIVTIDSPVNGIPDGGLREAFATIGRLHPRFQCALDGDVYWQLRERYVREGYRNTLRSLANQAGQQGITIVTIGNNVDCLWFPNACFFPLGGDYHVQYIEDSAAITREFATEAICLTIERRGRWDYDFRASDCVLESHWVLLASNDDNSLQVIADYIGMQN